MWPRWLPGVYPVLQTAQDGFERGELYVCKVDGVVVAAAKINGEQVDVYDQIPWEHGARDEEVLVIHTLVVAPGAQGRGMDGGSLPSTRTWRAGGIVLICAWTPTPKTCPRGGFMGH